MQKSFVIFYSWQSDIPDTRKIINPCLKKAVGQLNKKLDLGFTLELRIDSDTKGKTGSPSIIDTVLDKIDKCDIFIADVTIINSSSSGSKPTPNPNVMFELGYAVKALGWDRIICLNDNSVSNISELPFDIRSRRISGFKREKEQLTVLISRAIETIVIAYDSIIETRKKGSSLYHDNKIYDQIEQIYGEVKLKDTLEAITTSLHITDLEYFEFRELAEFYAQSINQFLNEELDVLFKEYLQALFDFELMCIQYLKVDMVKGRTLTEAKIAGIEITSELRHSLLQNTHYFPHKKPYSDEEWPDADRRINDNQRNMNIQVDLVYAKYKKFIMSFKKNILIH